MMKGQLSRTENIFETHKPPLLKSVTDDEDDNYSCRFEMYDVEAYLWRYDKMMRKQEDEKISSLCHLQPLLQLIDSFSKTHDTSIRKPVSMEIDPTNSLTKELHYSDLKRALETIEKDKTFDFMKTDHQWTMVLKMLGDNDAGDDDTISCAEIVQCYRTCVLAMQTLEAIPAPKSARKRVRERSLMMMSLFRPSACNSADSTASSNDALLQSDPLATHAKAATENIRNLANYAHILLAFSLGALMSVLIIWSQGSSQAALHENLFMLHTPPNIAGPIVSPFPIAAKFAVPVDPTLRVKSASSLSVSSHMVPPIIPGPIVAPFPVVSTSPQQLGSTARSLPASISSASMHAPSSSPSVSSKTTTSRKATSRFEDPSFVQYSAKSSFLKTWRGIKEVGRAESGRRLSSPVGVVTAGIVGSTTAIGLIGPAIASFFGGFSTNLVSLLPMGFTAFLPMGFTVVGATLLAHGIRDLIASFFKRFKQRSRQ